MLNALSDYYDCLRLQKDSGLVPDGYSKIGVNYNLVLNRDGTIRAVLPYMKNVLIGKKKKEAPREELFPFRNSVPGIAAETVDHREKYLFGIEWSKQEGKLVVTRNSLRAFEKCRDKSLSFLEGLRSPVIDAYVAFLKSWNPADGTGHPLLTAMGKKYGGAKFIVTSQDDAAAQIPLNRDPLVKKKWNACWRSRPAAPDAVTGQCSISGKVGPIARIHDNLTGIAGGLATGVNLVCLKSPAFWSYGRTESYNSSVSQEVMKKYTQAFNYLTSTPNHKQVIDDMTLLYWAMTSGPELPYLQTFGAMIGFFSLPEESPAERERGERQGKEEELSSVFRLLSQGQEADLQSFGMDKRTEFYLLGVKPNSSRLAVKIFEHNSFGVMIENAWRHQRDLQLSPSDRQMPLWLIGKVLKSPISSNEKLPPDLAAKILHSVLSGSPYPRFMLETAVRRAKTDRDNADKKFYAVSRDRVRIIKACLTRANYLQRGELTMTNMQNPETPYLCGRLFAVLEMIQHTAQPDINATIKDKFFSSACSTPYLVFPRLMKLSQSHLGKLREGSQVFYDKQIQEITSHLGHSFPKALSMEKQGMFILGYYQQREKLFESKDKGEKDHELA